MKINELVNEILCGEVQGESVPALLSFLLSPANDFEELLNVPFFEHLLSETGGMKQLLELSENELMEISQLDSYRAAKLLALGALLKRACEFEDKQTLTLDTPEIAHKLFRSLSFESQEILKAAFLTSSNRLIRVRTIFKGTVDASLASPREIIREALRANATKIIIAHNHPSEHAEPSKDDRELTRELSEACRIMGLSLVDHLIICGGGQYYSFAEAGEICDDDVGDMLVPMPIEFPEMGRC